ncbi:MAG: sigma-70 family RNA polymerase sigma factor [Blautia sp.]|nr:sigma-70 family RNA polymerase sigma factor [Blautia sp.]
MQAKQTDKTTEFRAMYDRQMPQVYRLALMLLGNAADAEDIAQQVFAKAWEKRPRFRDAGHENAWFITVTRNQSRDLLKSSYRRRRTALSDVPEPQMAFSSREEDALWLALQELPDKYRILVYLHYYGGYSLRELSHLLHRRESTLQTQLAEARKRLRDILEKEQGEEKHEG